MDIKCRALFYGGGVLKLASDSLLQLLTPQMVTKLFLFEFYIYSKAFQVKSYRSEKKMSLF